MKSVGARWRALGLATILLLLSLFYLGTDLDWSRPARQVAQAVAAGQDTARSDGGVPVNPAPTAPTNNNPSAANNSTLTAGALYIDQANPNCSDAGDRSAASNPATPWCSPAGLNEEHGRKFQPGDTIYLKSGTYNSPPVRLYSAGTAGQPISVRAYSGASVIIRGTGSASERLFELLPGANYWTFDGLNLESASVVSLLEANQVSGLTVRNSRLGPIPAAGATALHFSQVSGALVENISLTCLNNPAGRVVDQTSSDGLMFDNVQNSIVRGSTFADCGHITLALRNSANNLIERNTIENRLHTAAELINIPGQTGASSGNIFRQNLIRNYNQYPSYSTLAGIGLEILHASGNLVYNNIFQNGYNGATGLSISTDPSLGRSDNNKIFNNTFYQPGGRGIELAHFGNPSASNAISGNKIYNNIITGISAVGGANAASRNAPIALTFSDWESNNGYGNELKNNLLSAPDGALVKWRGADAVLRTAYTDAALNAKTFAQNNLGGEPLFAGAGSFRAASGSPVIGAGLCLAEVATDYDGRGRGGAACDIGAFESGLAATAPPPPPVATTTPAVPPGATTTVPQLPLVPRASSTPPRLPVITTNKPVAPKPPTKSAVSPTGPAATSGCREHWLCRQTWSECRDGRQTRECFELNYCGTALQRPALEQVCNPVAETITRPQATSSSLAERLNLTDPQAKTLAVLVPAFFATLAALITVLLRLWL